MRPPGHHALPDRAMGFCLLANGAIAVRHAQYVLDVGRVAVIDWDVHHGNGTQAVFYEDPSVLAVSLHEYAALAVLRHRGRDRGGSGAGHDAERADRRRHRPRRVPGAVPRRGAAGGRALRARPGADRLRRRRAPARPAGRPRARGPHVRRAHDRRARPVRAARHRRAARWCWRAATTWSRWPARPRRSPRPTRRRGARRRRGSPFARASAWAAWASDLLVVRAEEQHPVARVEREVVVGVQHAGVVEARRYGLLLLGRDRLEGVLLGVVGRQDHRERVLAGAASRSSRRWCRCVGRIGAGRLRRAGVGRERRDRAGGMSVPVRDPVPVGMKVPVGGSRR